jgi:hypothetical protein
VVFHSGPARNKLTKAPGNPIAAKSAADMRSRNSVSVKIRKDGDPIKALQAYSVVAAPEPALFIFPSE